MWQRCWSDVFKAYSKRIRSVFDLYVQFDRPEKRLLVIVEAPGQARGGGDRAVNGLPRCLRFGRVPSESVKQNRGITAPVRTGRGSYLPLSRFRPGCQVSCALTLPGYVDVRRPTALGREAMALDGPIFGEGIYAPREAARLIGATAQDVLRWTRGSGPYEPIWKAHYQFLNDSTEISFLDLIELRAVRALRLNGISIQAIRYAIKFAKEKYGIERPLSAVAFKTDGPEILMDAVEKDGELVSLAKKRAGQKVFRKIVDQSVSGLEYENAKLMRWRPDIAKHVVIDPDRAFGAPMIDEAGVSTQVLYRDWERSHDVKYVSRLYEIDDRLVRDAVHYEDRLNQIASAKSGQGLI